MRREPIRGNGAVHDAVAPTRQTDWLPTANTLETVWAFCTPRCRLQLSQEIRRLEDTMQLIWPSSAVTSILGSNTFPVISICTTLKFKLYCVHTFVLLKMDADYLLMLLDFSHTWNEYQVIQKRPESEPVYRSVHYCPERCLEGNRRSSKQITVYSTWPGFEKVISLIQANDKDSVHIPVFPIFSIQKPLK
jgi:hypothetical protein